MQNVLEAYKKNNQQKKMSKLLMTIGVGVFLVSLLLSGLEVSTLAGLAVVIMGYGILQGCEGKDSQILEDYRKEIENLPIERKKIEQVTIEEDVAYMVFEGGDLAQRQTEIVKTYIREPFLEIKKMPAGLEEIPEFKEKFPLPILFVPNKPVDTVVFKEKEIA